MPTHYSDFYVIELDDERGMNNRNFLGLSWQDHLNCSDGYETDFVSAWRLYDLDDAKTMFELLKTDKMYRDDEINEKVENIFDGYNYDFTRIQLQPKCIHHVKVEMIGHKIDF